jgi:transglutaminase-like putative cysteine protease
MLLDSTQSKRPTSSAPESITLPSRFDPQHRTIRPVGVYALHGLSTLGDELIALDSVRGYLVKIERSSDNTTILNPYNVQDFLDAAGLAVWGETIWFTRDHDVFWCTFADLTPQHFATLPYPAHGVAVWHSTIYVACQKAGYILVFDQKTGRQITSFSAPGVGIENLTVREEELWVCDRTEQTVYCVDRATGEVNFSILTPFDSPSGITFQTDPQTQSTILYVSYAGEEVYIRDDPNSEDPYQLSFRDRTFIHPLHFHLYEDQHYALSNGYLIEMSYIEELLPLEEVQINGLEWRIALPADTPRQTVKRVEPIGMPFVEETQAGQRVAVFKFDSLRPDEGRLFGWKALLEVRGIKYRFTFEDVEKIPSLTPEFQSRYLVDDDELAMDTPIIQAAAQAAIGTETNLLRKMLKIRNYVYDRLSYGIKPHIDTPDIALVRGVGSCGEYVGLLLALARINGIACRTVGRYKCPQPGDRQGVPLQPDFNHVWIEFYIPGFGWLPMESNVDDVVEGGPYPTRFFMGLPWYHAEIAKGIPFETLKTPDASFDLSIGDLAINHIRFTILGELPPPTA